MAAIPTIYKPCVILVGYLCVQFSLLSFIQALQGKNFLLVLFDNALKLISSILITFFSVIPLYDGGLTHFSARRLVVCTVLAISPSERSYMMSDIIRLVE